MQQNKQKKITKSKNGSKPKSTDKVPSRSNSEVSSQFNFEVLSRSNSEVSSQFNFEVLSRSNSEVLSQSNFEILSESNFEVYQNSTIEIDSRITSVLTMVIPEIDDTTPHKKPKLKYVVKKIEPVIKKIELLHTNTILWLQKNFRKEWNENDIVTVIKLKPFSPSIEIIRNLKFQPNGRWLLMREGVKPSWEDPCHKGYGYIYITLVGMNWREIFVAFATGVINNTLINKDIHEDTFDITGVTFVGEKNFKQIRLWCYSKNNPTINMFSENIQRYASSFKNETLNFMKFEKIMKKQSD
jgi:hypothetical protein